jgi:hypothetical protein
MDEQVRNEHRELLKWNPANKAAAEFVRTTNLERQLIEQYGFEAIRFIFDDRNSANYFPLGQFPDGCPWAHLNALDRRSAIVKLFAPIAMDVPALVTALSERCGHLYAEKEEARWVLHYFLHMVLHDGRPYYKIYTGGPPNPSPQVNSSLAKYYWGIPRDLAHLYSVHDGFGPILGCQRISVMAEMMDSICEEQNAYPEGYEFCDLLEFHPDGMCNAQCFDRCGGESATVDWDHETWELSNSQDFFPYIDERLSQLDEN